MDKRRCTRVLLWTLVCWTLIGLCCAGNRPFRRGEKPRYPRDHDRWTQRIQFPSLHDGGTQQIVYPSVNDQETQGIRYPSVHDRGQRIQYPSINDDDASPQIQVKNGECVMYLVVEGMLFCLSYELQLSVYQVWVVGDLETVISEDKGQSLTFQC